LTDIIETACSKTSLLLYWEPTTIGTIDLVHDFMTVIFSLN